MLRSCPHLGGDILANLPAGEAVRLRLLGVEVPVVALWWRACPDLARTPASCVSGAPVAVDADHFAGGLADLFGVVEPPVVDDLAAVVGIAVVE